jgi:hypothetical protein
MKALTISLLKEMSEAMAMREASGARPEEYVARLAYSKMHRAALVQHYRGLDTVNNEDLAELKLLSRALDGVNDALETQDRRETEELHMSSEVMRDIWDRAKNRATQLLAQLQAEESWIAPDVERVFKQRAEALGTALAAFGMSLKHSQLLQVSGRMYGYKCYQALRKAAVSGAPAFCPHCGAAGSLELAHPVPAARAQSAPNVTKAYHCRSCSGAFSVTARSSGHEPG